MTSKKKELFYLKDTDIICINSYKKECKYSNEFEKINVKTHLVIKYKILQDFEQSIISLNILLEEYQDLL